MKSLLSFLRSLEFLRAGGLEAHANGLTRQLEEGGDDFPDEVTTHPPLTRVTKFDGSTTHSALESVERAIIAFIRVFTNDNLKYH